MPSQEASGPLLGPQSLGPPCGNNWPYKREEGSDELFKWSEGASKLPWSTTCPGPTPVDIACMQKSPILATWLNPLQLRRQFLVAQQSQAKNHCQNSSLDLFFKRAIPWGGSRMGSPQG